MPSNIKAKNAKVSPSAEFATEWLQSCGPRALVETAIEKTVKAVT